MWLFNNKPFTSDDIGEFKAFVYLITCPDGRMYIGKKNFFQHRKPTGKKRRVTKESNWKTYWSSSDTIKALVKEYEESSFTRSIICLCKSEGDATYIEAKLLFQNHVLEDDNFINESIGNYRRKPSWIEDGRVVADQL